MVVKVKEKEDEASTTPENEALNNSQS